MMEYRKTHTLKTLEFGSDNVHYNKFGIVCLGRHMKYLSLLDCPRINTLR